MSDRDTSFIIRGKALLLVMLVSLPLMVIATLVTLRNVESRLTVDTQSLVWAERAAWPTPPIKRTTLVDQPSEFGRPPKNRWERLDFHLSPGVVALVQDAAALAAAPDFASDATGEKLRALASRPPGLESRAPGEGAEQPYAFYLDYLRGAWHAARNEHDAADEALTRAFAGAPAVIKLRFDDEQARPVPGLQLGTAELALDRVVDADPDQEGFQESLDQTLKLVYPPQVTDPRGQVYLPAFHTVYRWARKPDVAGHEVSYSQAEGWFQFPGKIGSPHPATVRPAGAQAAE